MTPYTVIVKGELADFTRETHSRRIVPMGDTIHPTSHGETVATVYADPQSMGEWFVETLHSPFPAGTLLYFAPRESESPSES